MKFLQEGSEKSMCKSVPALNKETPFENVNFSYTHLSSSNHWFIHIVIRSPEAGMNFRLVQPLCCCRGYSGSDFILDRNLLFIIQFDLLTLH